MPKKAGFVANSRSRKRSRKLRLRGGFTKKNVKGNAGLGIKYNKRMRLHYK